MGNFNISVKLKYARGFLCKIWKVNSLSNSNKNLLLSQPSAGGIVILSPRCFNKLSTSEFQQFLSLQYFVDTFYWSDGVGVCLGQVYCNSNIQPLGPPSQLFMQILCWCADTGRFQQCTIRLKWFNKSLY